MDTENLNVNKMTWSIFVIGTYYLSNVGFIQHDRDM